MHASIQHKLAKGQDPFTKQSGLPAHLVNQLASETICAVRGSFERLDAERLLRRADPLREIIDAERHSRPELERLACELVADNFYVNPEILKLSGKIVDPGTLPILTNVTPPHSDPTPAAKQEIAKRRIINAIIQGAAVGTENSIDQYSDRIGKFGQDLRRIQKQNMAFGHMGYWHLPLDHYEKMDSLPLVPHGLVRVDLETIPATVKAQAVCFPLLVHELSKGVVETLALHGLPTSRALRNEVLAHTDLKSMEAWDLRIGPALWRRVNVSLGCEDPRERNFKLKELFELPPAQFMERLSALIDGGC